MTRHNLTLHPDQIEVTVDQMGREHILIPDEIATYVASEIGRGWQTLRLGLGQSERYTPGTTMFDIAQVLLTTYANSSIPKVVASLRRAIGARQSAARGTNLPVTVVGQSAWDPELRCRRNDDSTAHLRVPCFVQADRDSAGAYRWVGVMPTLADAPPAHAHAPVDPASADDADTTTPSDEWYRTAAYSDIARYESGLLDYEPGPDHDTRTCWIPVHLCPACSREA